MKYAIFSDVHSNPAALEKVLADAERAGAERFVCCGDVVGYGPDPAGAIAILRERGIPTIMGNHDAGVADVLKGEWLFNPVADAGVRRNRKWISEEDRKWLSELPYLYEGEGFACAHGDFANPEGFGYVIDKDNALASMAARKEQLLFVGHVHRSYVAVALGSQCSIAVDPLAFNFKAELARFLVNVGSVGYPRIEPFSTYTLLDTESGDVEFRHVDFDFEGYVQALESRKIPMPDWLSQFYSSLES